MMNKNERKRMVKHALTVMRWYKKYSQLADGDPWKYTAERQAFRDCLESLVRVEFIKDYNFVQYTITFPDGSILGA